jgi:hypothetical protein
VFLLDDNDDDHGVRQADTAQALIWWRHLGASHEATNMFHRVMCLAPYPPGGMVVSLSMHFFRLEIIQ